MTEAKPVDDDDEAATSVNGVSGEAGDDTPAEADNSTADEPNDNTPNDNDDDTPNDNDDDDNDDNDNSVATIAPPTPSTKKPWTIADCKCLQTT